MFSISASRSEDRPNRARVDFLRIDSESALTLCVVALGKDDWEKMKTYYATRSKSVGHDHETKTRC